MPRAIVTGATGFVGQRLALELRARGWDVWAPRRLESTVPAALKDAGVITPGLADAAAIRDVIASAAPQAIFHLAAHQARTPTPGDVQAMVDANITLGTHILDAVIGVDCTVVNAMSYFQYRHGEAATHSLYAVTKQAYADIGTYHRVARGVDVRDVVLYDNYGTGDRRDKVVPALLTAARRELPVVTGPRAQTVNLLHVDDVAAGLIAAARRGEPALTTVRAAEPTTVGAIADEVEHVAGHPLELTIDDSRAVSDLPLVAGEWPTPRGWRPTVALADGLAAAYAATR